MNSLITKHNIAALEVKKDELIKLTSEHINVLIEGYIPFSDALIETGVINVGKLETLFNDVYKTLLDVNAKLQTINAIIDGEEGLKECEEVKTVLRVANECNKVTYGTYRDLLNVLMIIRMNKHDNRNDEAVEACMNLRYTIDDFIASLVAMVEGE